MGLVDRSPWSPLVGTMKIDTSLLPTRQEHEKGRFTHFSHSSVPLVNPVGSIRDCSPGGEKNCFLPPHLGVNPAIFKVPLGPSLPTDFSHSPVPLVSPTSQSLPLPREGNRWNLLRTTLLDVFPLSQVH